MPTESSYPQVDIPNVDLWGLMFEQKRKEGFSDQQVIYRALNPARYYTHASVKSTAIAFGEGLRDLWEWQKGDVMNVFALNDIDIGPCTYGVLHAGGIVSPANPGYSAEELAFMFKDAGAKAVVTQRALLPVALKAAKMAGMPEDRIILLGEERDPGMRFKHFTAIRKASGTNRYRRRKLNPDTDLAFLAYSSGTTGLPKGVMLSHRNIISDVLMITGSVGKSYNWEQDKILGVLPFFHIYGLTGLIHQPLYRGIELVVMPAFNLEVFCRTIQDHKITMAYVAPPVVVHLSRSDIVKNFDLSSLRMITSGAAPLTRELVDAVYARLKLKVNQAYGLSETSPMTHTQPWDEWYSSVGSVGKMFPNMTAKYISAEGKELGPGEPGELWLKGPNVFKGYWKNPAATKDAITEDGYFKTGDVGFQDKEHNFYITDRVKELIKYKGFQVAPAELEGLLMDNQKVYDVAVIGIDLKEEHTEVPRAYIVAAPGVMQDDASAQEIIKWMNGKVAYYKKLRGGVRFVDEIPKSAAGKILRRVLKDQAKEEDKHLQKSTPLKAKL